MILHILTANYLLFTSVKIVWIDNTASMMSMLINVATASLRRWLQCVYLGRALWICDGWRGEGGWWVHGSGVVSPAPPRSGKTRCRCQLRRAVLACHVSTLHSSFLPGFIVYVRYVYVFYLFLSPLPFSGSSEFRQNVSDRGEFAPGRSTRYSLYH